MSHAAAMLKMIWGRRTAMKGERSPLVAKTVVTFMKTMNEKAMAFLR